MQFPALYTDGPRSRRRPANHTPSMKRSIANVSPCCNARVRRELCTSCKRPAGTSKLRRSESTQPQIRGMFAASVSSGQALQKKLDKALDAPAPPRPGGAAGGSWSAADDLWLWANRSKPPAELGAHLQRVEGGITARLAHLQNPTHNAHQRLHGVAAPMLRAAPVAAEAIPHATLNAQQCEALQLAQQGISFFLTGGAGTGKTLTLGYVIRALKQKYGASSVFVTASTGIAACHVSGTTVHSFAGVGLASESAAELVQRVSRNRPARARWLSCRVLVIDEVSMLDGGFLDKVEQVARALRDATLPFGGIQLVLCGDFLQLPPVTRFGERQAFLFESATWRMVVQRTVSLSEVFRQSDSGFVSLLNEMRKGRLSAAHTDLLFAHLAKCRAAVTVRSHEQQRQIDGRTAFPDEGEAGAGALQAPAPPEGAAVHLPEGMPPSLSQVDSGPKVDSGAAVHLPEGMPEGMPEVKPDATPVGEAVKLYPQNAPADVENERRLGALAGTPSVYVANDSAAGKMDGCLAPPRLQLKVGAQVMLLKNLDAAQHLVNGSRGRVLRFEPAHAPNDVASSPQPDERERAELAAKAAELGAPPPSGLYPVVAFEGGVERHVTPEEWTIEQGGHVVARRIQVPLKLAYAISIHKSQGMTLPDVEIDLANCFEPGHAYVALSRAESLEGTRLLSFDPRRVFAHPAVLSFYAALEADAAPAVFAASPDPVSSSAPALPGAPAPPTPMPQAAAPPACGGLTAEQRARMEANRAAALARRNGGGGPTVTAPAMHVSSTQEQDANV